MKFNNLDEIEKFTNENLENWTIRRGQNSYMKYKDHKPADDFEVLQLFKPGETEVPYAEFWRGFFDFAPNSYEGCYGINLAGCNGFGDLNFAMNKVWEEYNKIKMCQKIINALEQVIETDNNLKEIYQAISEQNIRKVKSTIGCYYQIECSHFKCKPKQRCIMVVIPNESEKSFKIKYRLETWCKDHYEVDTSNEYVV